MKKINEKTKVTLSIGQLKRLIKESEQPPKTIDLGSYILKYSYDGDDEEAVSEYCVYDKYGDYLGVIEASEIEKITDGYEIFDDDVNADIRDMCRDLEKREFSNRSQRNDPYGIWR